MTRQADIPIDLSTSREDTKIGLESQPKVRNPVIAQAFNLSNFLYLKLRVLNKGNFIFHVCVLRHNSGKDNSINVHAERSY